MEGAGIVIIAGAFLIVVGAGLAISEHRAKNRRTAHPGAETKPAGLAESIDAFDRLLNTIKGFQVGVILIVLGVLCFIIGGAMADSADLLEVAKEAIG
jgi:energy-converting hydrogenase Eha subunit E